MTRKNQQDTRTDSGAARDERLKSALRENLRRRKAQAKARKADTEKKD